MESGEQRAAWAPKPLTLRSANIVRWRVVARKRTCESASLNPRDPIRDSVTAVRCATGFNASLRNIAKSPRVTK